MLKVGELLGGRHWHRGQPERLALGKVNRNFLFLFRVRGTERGRVSERSLAMGLPAHTTTMMAARMMGGGAWKAASGAGRCFYAAVRSAGAESQARAPSAWRRSGGAATRQHGTSSAAAGTSSSPTTTATGSRCALGRSGEGLVRGVGCTGRISGHWFRFQQRNCRMLATLASTGILSQVVLRDALDASLLEFAILAQEGKDDVRPARARATRSQSAF